MSIRYNAYIKQSEFEKELNEKYKKNKTKKKLKKILKQNYILCCMIVSEIIGVIVCHLFNIPVFNEREIRQIGSMILFIPFILLLLILILVMIIDVWKETKEKTKRTIN